MKRAVVLIISAHLLISFSGCTEYWWTRGQPPSSKALLERANSSLTGALPEQSTIRPEATKYAEQIQIELNKAVELIAKGSAQGELSDSLLRARSAFVSLENHLTLGSRPAYAELAGQLRRFTKEISSGGTVDQSAFGLFAARSISFLAKEVSISG